MDDDNDDNDDNDYINDTWSPMTRPEKDTINSLVKCSSFWTYTF